MQLMQQTPKLHRRKPAQPHEQTMCYPPALCLSLNRYPWENLTHFLLQQRFSLLQHPLRLERSIEFPWHRRSSHLHKRSPNAHICLRRSQRSPRVISQLLTVQSRQSPSSLPGLTLAINTQARSKLSKNTQSRGIVREEVRHTHSSRWQ